MKEEVGEGRCKRKEVKRGLGRLKWFKFSLRRGGAVDVRVDSLKAGVRQKINSNLRGYRYKMTCSESELKVVPKGKRRLYKLCARVEADEMQSHGMSMLICLFLRVDILLHLQYTNKKVNISSSLIALCVFEWGPHPLLRVALYTYISSLRTNMRGLLQSHCHFYVS